MYIVKSFAYSLICMKQCKKKGTTYQVWRTHTHLCKDGKLFFITPQFQALKILARFSTGWRGQTDDHPWQWTLPESGCKRDLFVIHIHTVFVTHWYRGPGYKQCASRIQLYMFEYILFISPVSLLSLPPFLPFPTIFSISPPSSLPSLSPSLSPPLFFSFLLLLSTRLQRCYTGQLNRVKRRALN